MFQEENSASCPGLSHNFLEDGLPGLPNSMYCLCFLFLASPPTHAKGAKPEQWISETVLRLNQRIRLGKVTYPGHQVWGHWHQLRDSGTSLDVGGPVDASPRFPTPGRCKHSPANVDENDVDDVGDTDDDSWLLQLTAVLLPENCLNPNPCLQPMTDSCRV